MRAAKTLAQMSEVVTVMSQSTIKKWTTSIKITT